MEILNDSAKQCSNQRKYGKSKLKLNIWNNDIKIAIKQNKLAHKQWKEAGKPKSPEHPLLLHKVETRKIDFHSFCIYKCRTMKIDLKFAVSNKFF
jgi:hypothetical protein